jgi:endonuclease/exonuclease/phosphatase (EEP) superfamily protein YafD
MPDAPTPPPAPLPHSTSGPLKKDRLRGFLWPDWTARKRMLRAEAWLVVLAAYPLLAFAYLWPQDWRNESATSVWAGWVAFLIRALQFHLGLLLLIVAVVAALRRGRRLFLAALPPTLFVLVPAFGQFLPRGAEASRPPTLRVMSVNLLMVNDDTDGIIGEIRAARPDVLLLQEYTAEWHRALQAAIAAEYPHHSVVERDDSFGIGLYSRTPFAGEVDQRFPLGRAGVEQQRAELEVGGRRFAIYNIHLLPPRTPLYTSEHRLQFADLVDALKAERLPYVVGGDFNFPETSPQHADLRRAGVREAHELAGAGRGATWPVNSVFRYVVPGIRIDHVYLSPDLTATRCETGVGSGSDHRPVVVDVAPRAPTAQSRPAH